MPQTPEEFLESLAPAQTGKQSPEDFLASLDTAPAAAAPAPAPAGKSFGSVLGDAATDVLSKVGKTAHALGEGAMGAVGLPGDLERAAFPHASWYGFPSSKQTGGDLKKAEEAVVPGSSEVMKPSDDAERYMMAGARGIGGGLVFGPASGLGLPVAAASGLGGGLAAEGAHDTLPNSKMAPIIAGMVGGGIGQGVLNGLTREGLRAVASRVGGATSVQDAGERLQAAARNWVENTHSGLQGEAWAPLDAAIPGNTQGSVRNFQSALVDLRNNATITPGGQVPPSLRNNTYQRVLLNPSWQNMSRLRTQLGEELTKPQALRDMGEQNISRLYSALTDDMRTSAHSVSPELGQAFDAANQRSRELFDTRMNLMKLYNPKSDVDLGTFAPDKVASKLLATARTGGNDLQYYRGVLPQQVDDLAAGALHDGMPFHRMHALGQEALIPDEATRNSAITASRASTMPSLHDTAKNEARAVYGILSGDMAEAGAGMLGLPAPAAKLVGGLTPYGIVGMRRVAGTPPQGPLIGGAVGEEELPQLTVRPKKRD